MVAPSAAPALPPARAPAGWRGPNCHAHRPRGRRARGAPRRPPRSRMGSARCCRPAVGALWAATWARGRGAGLRRGVGGGVSFLALLAAWVPAATGREGRGRLAPGTWPRTSPAPIGRGTLSPAQRCTGACRYETRHCARGPMPGPSPVPLGGGPGLQGVRLCPPGTMPRVRLPCIVPLDPGRVQHPVSLAGPRGLYGHAHAVSTFLC